MDMIPEWHDLGYEMTNNLYLDYDIIISFYILRRSVSYHIMFYHVMSVNVSGSLIP
jgi:hypothetical protein